MIGPGDLVVCIKDFPEDEVRGVRPPVFPKRGDYFRVRRIATFPCKDCRECHAYLAFTTILYWCYTGCFFRKVEGNSKKWEEIVSKYTKPKLPDLIDS